jgi:predicted O-methyltransferase YrrM
MGPSHKSPARSSPKRGASSSRPRVPFQLGVLAARWTVKMCAPRNCWNQWAQCAGSQRGCSIGRRQVKGAAHLRFINPMARYRALRETTLGLLFDGRALAMLPPLQSGYAPWNGASLRPSAVQMLITEVLLSNKQRIVEFGPGVSTLYLGHAARENGGRVWSFEHDDRWRNVMLSLLRRESLLDVVKITHAPLGLCDSPRGPVPWYSVSAVREALGETTLDFLLVDGPPAGEETHPWSRYPAVPQLRERFDADTSIFLDDIVRPGEAAICKAWEREMGVVFRSRPISGRIGWARTGGGWTL